MKIINIIGHPVLVMCMFLLIIISGEHFGGFYLLYILMGLSGGAPHAILALVGLLFVFIGYKVYRSKPNIIKPFLYVIGISNMILALITFFDKSQGYNDGTFVQTVPLITLILFSLCTFFCIIHTFWLAAKILKTKDLKIDATPL